jgi:phage regulator Rha-like protein
MELQLIQSKIYTLHNLRVMLDFDLAEFYGVATKRLKEAVRRNIERFPEDFVFELTREENNALRTQIASLEVGRGKHSKYTPFAFTEHGVAMLSGILNSPKAIEINIAIIRAFISMRHHALSFAELSEKVLTHDKELGDIVEVLRWLGEENQARYEEIQALQTNEEQPIDWEDRARIGFRKGT